MPSASPSWLAQPARTDVQGTPANGYGTSVIPYERRGLGTGGARLKAAAVLLVASLHLLLGQLLLARASAFTPRRPVGDGAVVSVDLVGRAAGAGSADRTASRPLEEMMQDLRSDQPSAALEEVGDNHPSDLNSLFGPAEQQAGDGGAAATLLKPGERAGAIDLYAGAALPSSGSSGGKPSADIAQQASRCWRPTAAGAVVLLVQLDEWGRVAGPLQAVRPGREATSSTALEMAAARAILQCGPYTAATPGTHRIRLVPVGKAR